MAYTHTFKTLASGKTLYKSTFMNTGGYTTPISPRFIELQGTNQLRFEDIKYSFLIDLSADTVILKNSSDTTTATYGVGGTGITNAALNIVFDPLFPKANSSSGGTGATVDSLDDVPQGTSTKKLTAAEYANFKAIEATFFS